jgi:hypothetical protein
LEQPQRAERHEVRAAQGDGHVAQVLGPDGVAQLAPRLVRARVRVRVRVGVGVRVRVGVGVRARLGLGLGLGRLLLGRPLQPATARVSTLQPLPELQHVLSMAVAAHA